MQMGESRQIRDRQVQAACVRLQGTEVDVDDEPLRRFCLLGT